MLLGKSGQFGLLSALAGQIVVPRAVAEEVGARADVLVIIVVPTTPPRCPERRSWHAMQ